MNPDPKWSDSLFFVYGPPGSGKTTIGEVLAKDLNLPFIDLDEEIRKTASKDIPEIFAQDGEEAFRALETRALETAVGEGKGVIALGGGALLSSQNRAIAEESGQIICLAAELENLIGRLEVEADQRPLLGGGDDWRMRLARLVETRRAHYDSFPNILQTDALSPEEVSWQIQILAGAFHVKGMGTSYDVRVQPGGIRYLGDMLLSRGLKGPVALVCDENVLPLYGKLAQESLESAGFEVSICALPSGENEKTIRAVTSMWSRFVEARLERGSTVIGLGGGVTTDLAGFAAATFLRGVRWVAVPTTLLGMVDASLGGKTGFDLPQGKNLVGAFHPPSLVLADPLTLDSLPLGELRSGMAEVVKHGIIADPLLFEICSQGWSSLRGPDSDPEVWVKVVKRSIAVKIRVIQSDPYEKGIRATLNLGHTLGHAIEAASNYRLRHGEAVAIGMAAVARLAEESHLCQPGLAAQIIRVLAILDLPTEIPSGLDSGVYMKALKLDKKRSDGKILFAVPTRIGEVRPGIELDVDFAALLPEAA